MDEMGHTDPALALALGVYRQAMRPDEGEKAALRALVEGEIVADGGRREQNGALVVVGEGEDSNEKTALAGLS